MRYSDIKEFDLNNGEGIRVSLFVSGCEFRCKSCHNKIAWDKNYGKEFTEDTYDLIKKAVVEDIEKDLSILGGEPLTEYNRYDVLNICMRFKNDFPDKEIWLWSGYRIEEIREFMPEILKVIDVLVDGLYEEDKQMEGLLWRGSYNQRIINLKQFEQIIN